MVAKGKRVAMVARETAVPRPEPAAVEDTVLVGVRLNPERLRCREVVYLPDEEGLTLRLEAGVNYNIAQATAEALLGQLDENGVPFVVLV